MNKRSAEISRQNILGTAMQVFAEHGYTQASMRTIARVAGISVGGLYLYFRSKEELYLTLLEQWMDDLNQSTAAALAATANSPDAIRAFITISLDFARSHRKFFLQGREPEICGGESMQRFFSHRRGVIEGIIRDGIASGAFVACRADEAARIVFCTLRGFFVSMDRDDDALFSPDACSTLILNGLMARHPIEDTR